jgi:hypothetical protein
MAAEKKCFVIMPITTPPGMEDKYGDGPEHFDHVYECLFKPSVEAAGYIPIPPKATGSQNIHANIIKNLETADLVLCDMSGLNPNVFFEWGIRTSLNKPVCVVKDDLTKDKDVPFDVGTLQWEEYSSRLEVWEIKKQCEKLTKHLQDTVEKSSGGNELWKHFGLKEAARVFEPEKGEKGQLDYLTMQMEALQQKVDSVIRMKERYTTKPGWSQDIALRVGGEETREGPDVEGALQFVREFVDKKKGWQLIRIDQVRQAEIRVAFRADTGMRNESVEKNLAKAVREGYDVGIHFVCVG